MLTTILPLTKKTSVHYWLGPMEPATLLVSDWDCQVVFVCLVLHSSDRLSPLACPT